MSRSRYPFLPVASLLLSATLWGVLWYPLRLLAEQGCSVPSKLRRLIPAYLRWDSNGRLGLIEEHGEPQ